MHIVMLSDWETRGGAAVAASRLAMGLAAAGARVTRLVVFPDRQPHPWHTERLGAPLFSLRRAARRVAPLAAQALLDRLARPAAEEALERALRRLRPDVVHLHNLHGGIGAGWSPRFLAVAARHAPVVWTLHDMWPLTGRCVYSYACERFMSGCNAACPTPRVYPALPLHLVGPAWEERRALVAATPRLAAVTPSRWMAATARQGLWAGRRVEHIPNGLPLDQWRPLPRAAARRALGLPINGPVALLAMPDLSDPRKGAGLLPALGPTLPPGLTLLAMGAGRPPLRAPGVRVVSLGFVAAADRQATIYSAADLLIHAAPQDNAPLTVQEALACGTPVAALPVGGLPDLVRPGQTGWLAARPDAAGLAAVVAEALNAIAAGADLREPCRAVAEREYGLELMVERHLALYREIGNA
ncbi:MAG: glycosyltransferase [Oscillochloridaceae bacterium]|nr:glycosyltransferase [Chloroflexaceae bacterium]MDW8388739.1 glycosyltransferase [Oscillochloridaceae bacterium]